MKILIYGLNFSPELTGVGKYTGEMAAFLARQGHEVEVVTAYPHYPEWKLAPSDRAFRYRRELLAGVHVNRCPIWLPRSGRVGGLKRIFFLLSFAITSMPSFFRVLARFRPDAIWTVEPTFACVPAAWAGSRIFRIPIWLHVQDLEIDAAFALGVLRGKWIRKFALSIESFFMRRMDRVSTISPMMRKMLQKKKIRESRLVAFPNWIDTSHVYPLDRPSSLRKELGIGEQQIVALYSGNLGGKQGLETLLDAIRIAQDRSSSIRFVICGDGSSKSALQLQARGLDGIIWLPLQPFEKLNELLNLADIHLLPQHADANDLVLPSKLTGMLASGRPIVATVGIETGIGVIVQHCGKLCPPGDPEKLLNSIEWLANIPADHRKILGARGREWATRELSDSAILKGFEKGIQNLIRS